MRLFAYSANGTKNQWPRDSGRRQSDWIVLALGNIQVMKRICFVLQVKPNRLEEYRERHRDVWPEMQNALQKTGWANYSLFLRPDGLLVGYLETEDFDRARNAMAELEVNQRWQREMASFFVHLDGLPPDRAMEPLEEVFHLNGGIKSNANNVNRVGEECPASEAALFSPAQ